MRIFFIVEVLALTLFILACSESVTSPTQSANSTADVKAVPSSATNLKTQSVSGITLVIENGTTAKYSIGERLARFNTPMTAEGITQQVTGKLAFDTDGKILAGSSIAIDATSFKSDENKRDNWVRRNGGLGQEITFAAIEVKDIPWPLPTSGSATFVIVGDMTISGTTVSTDWKTIADFSGDEITGTAATSINWNQFNLSKPRLPFIISVDDDISLELNFKTTR